ncbi:hypothetical protein BDV93DRAFT_565230 [Ceratobasidium sp. AG-I]|nr:hypothetical protein BDV93DRAFT_565230 [Ceratobasidium sp. AG-I]
MSALKWWQNLLNHSNAHILALLAIKLFSICANSMAEERTMSIIPCLNTHLRSCQNVSMLVDQVQIATWSKYGPEAPAPEFKEVEVEFRDIKAPRLDKGKAKESESSTSNVATAEVKGAVEGIEEGDDGDDGWLDEPEQLMLTGNKKSFDASEVFDLSHYRLRDLLSPMPVKPAIVLEDTEADSILPQALPSVSSFVFKLT